MATTTEKTVWELLEDPPRTCDDIANLYSWSTNYDAGKGPFTLFLDLIGWSQDNLGEKLYDMTNASLGYVELDKLARALMEYNLNLNDCTRFIDALIGAERDA